MGEAAYDAELSRMLASAESLSFWFRARNRLVVSLLERYFPAPASVLEVGCGNGFVLAGIRDGFAKARLVSVDLFDEALEIARKRVPMESSSAWTSTRCHSRASSTSCAHSTS